MSVLVWLLFLVCACFSREAWPKPMQVINTSFDNSPFVSLFAAQTAKHAKTIREVLDRIRSQYLNVADIIEFETYVNNAYSSDLAAEFVRAVPDTKYTDFLLYNSFFEVASNSMVALMSGVSPAGTYMGYSQTIDNKISYADELYKYLQELTYEVNYLDGEYSAVAVTFAGSLGYSITRSDYAELIISRVFDNGGTKPFPAIQDDNHFSFLVTELAKRLADGYELPSQLFQSFIYEIYESKSLPTPTASDYFIRNGSRNYPYSYLIAFANFAEYMGQILTTDNVGYSRTLDPSTDDGWRIVQSPERYNMEKPMKSDFRIIQIERALDSNVKDSRTLDSFSNMLRTYPFRQSTTVYITTLSGTEEVSNLQKCTNIMDAAKSIVACADPPPPTNWLSVILSLVLIVVIIVGWVFGIKNAKKYEQGLYENARDSRSPKAKKGVAKSFTDQVSRENAPLKNSDSSDEIVV
ncbi:TMP52 [Giardia lamblia P15]|uniref:TMP52 n=1 Tax=Giardia intestinalis (strain P15) TaxID=658858 RepID=E1F8Q0_GIAIA|nr:TMP52 [Giardia lamblia P15]